MRGAGEWESLENGRLVGAGDWEALETTILRRLDFSGLYISLTTTFLWSLRRCEAKVLAAKRNSAAFRYHL